MRTLELLSPAADKFVARQAILHGADAVYMGGPSHGARSKASNSIEDIREVVEFAHQFRARVYITVNTLVYEHELKHVEKMVWQLYRAGVDAIIVQDTALLRLKLPPIALHASTQCDTRTPDKAKFLQDVGFSQIVLARELSLNEINDITQRVSVPVEVFVHGALCVSYSGRCAISALSKGRSANRGECAQFCRLPYSLKNGRGEVVAKDKYLLSLKDLNTLSSLPALVEAGASSFKIEGRLKDADYVKNVTAAYRIALDKIISANPGKYCRASYGDSQIKFQPNLAKSFNRGFTDYFVNGVNQSIASIRTPKSLGEPISDVAQLNNGDGISFFNSEGEYEGVRVNRVEGDRIIGSRPFKLPVNGTIHRTFDQKWQQVMQRDTAERRVAVDITLDNQGVSASDERGVKVRISLDCELFEARKPFNPLPVFEKLGGTHYRLRNFTNLLDSSAFIPASQLTALRRKLIEQLDAANRATYKYEYRQPELAADYPVKNLDARSNVANSLADSFYRAHGVDIIEPAIEIDKSASARQQEVMTTRYCVRRQLGCCLRDKNVDQATRERFKAPLSITTGPHTFLLDFDCVNCEMRVLKPTKN